MKSFMVFALATQILNFTSASKTSAEGVHVDSFEKPKKNRLLMSEPPLNRTIPRVSDDRKDSGPAASSNSWLSLSMDNDFVFSRTVPKSDGGKALKSRANGAREGGANGKPERKKIKVQVTKRKKRRWMKKNNMVTKSRK